MILTYLGYIEGLKPRKQRNNLYGWSGGKVYTMLNDARYTGKDQHFKIPAIIEESLFTRAQEKLSLAKKIQRNPVGHLLQGYVFCPICGTRLNIVGVRHRAYFRCRGHNKQGCIAKPIRESWHRNRSLKHYKTP